MDSMYEFLLIHPHCTLVLDNIRLLSSCQCSGYKMVSHSLILNLCDYYWECTFSLFVYLHLYSLLWGMSVLFLMIFFFFNFYLFIYLFLAVLGLCFCARAFSSCSERGPLFIAVRGPLTIAASLAAEHRLQSRRFSSCCSRA